MDLVQLQYFISVAKHRNFSAAARENYVSQPCISHQIKELEKELNAQLFSRNTKTVELTTLGEIFLEDAKKIIDTLENSKTKLVQSDRQLELNILHLPSATRHFLPTFISAFKKEYPHIKVHLHRHNAHDLAEASKEHAADIYFSMPNDLASVKHLNTKIIQTDHYCLVTPQGHPASEWLQIDYNKLASEPFVEFNPEHAEYMHKQFIDICRQLGFTPRVVETFNVYEDMLYAVEAGIGLAILPYKSKGYIQNPLVYTLLDISNVSIDLCLAWDKEIKNPAVPLFLKSFWNYLKENSQLFL